MVLTDYRQSLQLWMRSFLVNKVKAETNYIAGYGVQRNDIKELITNRVVSITGLTTFYLRFVVKDT